MWLSACSTKDFLADSKTAECMIFLAIESIDVSGSRHDAQIPEEFVPFKKVIAAFCMVSKRSPCVNMRLRI